MTCSLKAGRPINASFIAFNHIVAEGNNIISGVSFELNILVWPIGAVLSVNHSCSGSRAAIPEWREMVAGYQRATAEATTRFDGHVAKYLGSTGVIRSSRCYIFRQCR